MIYKNYKSAIQQRKNIAKTNHNSQTRRNMKNLINIVVLLASISAVAQRRNGSYQTRIDDFRGSHGEGSVAKQLCKKFAKAKNRLALKACNNADEAARRQAKKIASKAGAYLGCIDGYAQGFNDGFVYTKDPTSSQLSQAQSMVNSMNMPSAESRAIQKAASVGESTATDDVIKQFRSAVRTKVTPKKTYNYPRLNFDGFSDGFRYDNKSRYAEAVDAGYVRADDPFESQAEARIIHKISKKAQYRAETICDHRGTMFASQGGVNLWRLHRAQREMDLAKYAWDDPKTILKNFLQNGGPLSKKYAEMKTWKVKETIADTSTTSTTLTTTTTKRPRSQRAGGPRGDKDKKKNKPQTSSPEAADTAGSSNGGGSSTVERVVNREELKELQDVYKKSFSRAYKRFYAKRFASKTYAKAGNQIYPAAVLTGELVGEKVAQEKAQRRFYNQKYQILSKNTYVDEVEENYEQSYDQVYARFSSAPVVELTSFSVEGVDNDGIFRPIEKLRANISATNLGLVNGQVRAQLGGHKINALGSHMMSVPRLGTINTTTPIIGQLDSSLRVDDQVQAILKLTGNFDVSDLVATTDAQGLEIHEIAEISQITPKISATDGNGGVLVTIENPSRKATTAMVEVKVKIQGKVFSMETEELGAGQSRSVFVPIDELDVIDVIRSSQIDIEAQVLVNGKVLHASSTAQSTGSQANNLAIYFAKLASNPSLASRTDLKNDLQIVSKSLIKSVQQSIDNKVNWKKKGQVDRTMIRKIQTEYQSLKISGKMNTATQAVFSSLAEELVMNLYDIKGFLWLRFGRRKAFVKEINKFAPSMNYKLAKKLAKN